MAVYIPIRPKWNPRGVVVNYVSQGQLCVRSWPRGYCDANTPDQRRQRGRMAQVCNVLPYIKNLLAIGYSPQIKRNGRTVGSYHVAVSTALREWFAATPKGDTLDCARIRLTDGMRPLPMGLRIERSSETLRIAWGTALQWNAAKLLLAVQEPIANQWVSVPISLEKGAKEVTVRLPATWRGRKVEVWIAFAGKGNGAKSKTHNETITAKTVSFTSTSPSPSRSKKIVAAKVARKGRTAQRQQATNNLHNNTLSLHHENNSHGSFGKDAVRSG